jgi:uncharacterized pyridoxal phosphate-containing UPF0001 family protein
VTRGEPAADARTAELARGLETVEQRVRAACAVSGRRREEITLVVVTKTFPAADAVRLAGLGVHELAENRDQEAGPKAAEVAAAGVDVRWHFVGQLQRNKARSVARYADVVHSVDRQPLVTALDRAAGEAGRDLDVLLQVDLGGAAERPDASRAAGLRDVHPDATWLSAGMSGDLEQAVAAGATHLRVGSAVLGSRPPL